MQLHQYFDFHVSRAPESICLIFENAQYSYGDIAKQSQKIAAGLLALDVEANDRVAILCENCPEYLSFLLACSRVGAVAVPINYRLAPPEVAFVLEDCQAGILLSPDESMSELISSLPPTSGAVKTLIATDQADQYHWETWLNSQTSTPIKCDTYNCEAVLQLYTSGTTGKPKGVVLGHDNLTSLFAKSVVAVEHKSGPGSRDLVSAPPFHIGGAGTLILPIMAGGSVVLHRSFNPFAVVEDLEKYRVESSFIVPAMILAIVQMVPDLDKRDFSALKQIMYGASPISTALLKQALEIFDCDFYQAYGMTETCGTIVTLSPEDHRQALAGKPELLEAAGRPQAGVEAKVVNSSGEPLPCGEIGELMVRSTSNMLEYFNRPEATAETLVDGWVKTGDSAIIDGEGYIFLRDRIKDMIVSGAENIYPIEVENIISQHPSVGDVAVIGIPDEKYGETPLACVVLKPEAELNIDELIGWCRGKLAGYKIPRKLKIYEGLPRNPSGKILKRDLREPFWEGRERQIN